MALDPASYPLLWALSDATGLRPEYVIPVLFSESGLNPAARNSLNYSGLNQISASYLSSRGISVDDYVTWPASAQIQKVVIPFMTGLVRALGPIKSGARLYQANFLPASVKTARALSSVLASSPSAVYNANAGLDSDRSGSITVQDMANAVARAAKASLVVASINAAYALRPNENPRDPVYGEDFGMSALATGALVTAIVAGSYLTARYIRTGRAPWEGKLLQW